MSEKINITLQSAILVYMKDKQLLGFKFSFGRIECFAEVGHIGDPFIADACTAAKIMREVETEHFKVVQLRIKRGQKVSCSACAVNNILKAVMDFAAQNTVATIDAAVVQYVSAPGLI